MKNQIKILRNKFKEYNIDGYVVPRNDDYFTEYSKINRLKFISNFSGSAGLAIILKNKNYLFTDGRYTIQSQIESGKNFKIINFEKNLREIDVIYDFYVSKFDRDYIYYQVIFNGTQINFLQLMKENGFDFNIQNKVWILQ